MTYGFQRTATGRVVLRVDDVERGLLMSVARQVMDLVQPAEASPIRIHWRRNWAGSMGMWEFPTTPQWPDSTRCIRRSDDARDFRGYRERSASVEDAACNDRGGRNRTFRRKGLGDVDRQLAWAFERARIAIGTRIQISEDNHEENAGRRTTIPDRACFMSTTGSRSFKNRSLHGPALYGFSDDDVPWRKTRNSRDERQVFHTKRTGC